MSLPIWFQSVLSFFNLFLNKKKLDQKEKIEPNILIYINRLSDALFMIAREVNRLEKKKEEIWKAK